MVHPDRNDYPLHIYARRINNLKMYFPHSKDEKGIAFFADPQSPYALFYTTSKVPHNCKWKMYQCVKYAMHWIK